MVRIENKKLFGGSPKKNSSKGPPKKKLRLVNLTLKYFFLRFPCYIMLLKKSFLGQFCQNKKIHSEGHRKKNFVCENTDHAPQMINGRPLIQCPAIKLSRLTIVTDRKLTYLKMHRMYTHHYGQDESLHSFLACRTEVKIETLVMFPLHTLEKIRQFS